MAANTLADAAIAICKKANEAPNLSGLLPLAGGVLGLCIAYLSLPTFRHRDKVADHAIAALDKLGDFTSDVVSGCQKDYLKLVRFAKRKLSHKSHQNIIEYYKENERHIASRAEQSNTLFSFLFRHRNALFISFSLEAIIILIALALEFYVVCVGSASDAHLSASGILHNAAIIGKSHVEFFYWTSIALIFMPLVFVWLGDVYTRKTSEEIDRCKDYCEEKMTAYREKQNLPTTSPQVKGSEEIEELAEAIAKKLAPRETPLSGERTATQKPPKEKPRPVRGR